MASKPRRVWSRLSRSPCRRSISSLGSPARWAACQASSALSVAAASAVRAWSSSPPAVARSWATSPLLIWSVMPLSAVMAASVVCSAVSRLADTSSRASYASRVEAVTPSQPWAAAESARSSAQLSAYPACVFESAMAAWAASTVAMSSVVLVMDPPQRSGRVYVWPEMGRNRCWMYRGRATGSTGHPASRPMFAAGARSGCGLSRRRPQVRRPSSRSLQPHSNPVPPALFQPGAQAPAAGALVRRRVRHLHLPGGRRRRDRGRPGEGTRRTGVQTRRRRAGALGRLPGRARGRTRGAPAVAGAQLDAARDPVPPHDHDHLDARLQRQGQARAGLGSGGVDLPRGHPAGGEGEPLSGPCQGTPVASTGTRSRLIRRMVKRVEEIHGPVVVPLPGRTAFYALVERLATGKHTFGSAVTRRQTANRPAGAFTPTFAARPGEQVQIDSTPIDVMVLLDNGLPAGGPDVGR